MKRTLYFNGDILTMGNPLYAEAVLVRDGVITHVGNRDDLLSLIDRETNICNLNGGILMPGFIDTHSHFYEFAQSLGAARLEGCDSFADLGKIIRGYTDGFSTEEWIIGSGYDVRRLQEHKHPDCHLLETFVSGRPLLITHAGGQTGVFNETALRILGIDRNTQEPQKNSVGKFADGSPNGLMTGQALRHALTKIPRPSEAAVFQQLWQAQQIYARYGITTVQEARTNQAAWDMLRKYSDSGQLKLDVVCYVDPKKSKNIAQENISRVQQYKRHLKINGYKLFFDGHPQNKTAWMLDPYFGQSDKSFCGLPIYSDEEAQMLLYEALNDHMQVAVHCNGDAAAEQLISCVEHLTEGKDLDLRPVMIHGLYVRPDQLFRMSKIGMGVSFFVPHVYFYGDKDTEHLGEQRASMCAPCQSARDAGIAFTLHQNTPTLMPNMLHSVWCAVNRQTAAGKVLGEAQQVSTLDALRAVTANAAHQYFEEDWKGIIAPGMTADFVILDYNPLRVAPEDIKRVRVLKTIKNDEIVFDRDVQA